MNVRRFRRLFRTVLLSASPVSLIACVSRTEMPEQAACFDVAGVDRYARLTLNADVDGIAFATRGDAYAVATALSPTPTERLPDLGLPCARARDRSACESEVARLLADPSTASWYVQTSEDALPTHVIDLGVITAGDDVRIATLADVIAAAAPIETREEAATALVLQNYRFDCGAPNVRPEAGGWTFKKTRKYCDGQETEYFTRVDRDGKASQAGTHDVHEGDNSCIEGRRPANLVATDQAWLSSLTACFSEIAHMEAAAVVAFDDLHRALARHAAPPHLLARVRRARADEIEHAAITARLASRFGGRPPTPELHTATPAHDLLALALENAVEGCVREAYGALVAAHQAAHAADPGVRSVFARIAKDEARHAELSLTLDAWLQSKLSSGDRALVESAKDRAFTELEVASAAVPVPEVVAVAGVPTEQAAQTLLRQLRWAALQNAA